MPRKKVKLAFITNDSARKAAHKKRKKGMLKKIEELSVLCGIEACAIVYSPYDPEPEIWPSEWGVNRVLEKFRTMPEFEQSKKMANQESFIAQRIQKGNEQMKKLMRDNREKEMNMFMFHCLNAGRVLPDNNMTVADLNDLSSVIEHNLRDISKRLETLNVNEMTRYQPQIQTCTATLAVPKTEEMTLLNDGHGLDMTGNPMQRQRFMDLLNGNGLTCYLE